LIFGITAEAPIGPKARFRGIHYGSKELDASCAGAAAKIAVRSALIQEPRFIILSIPKRDVDQARRVISRSASTTPGWRKERRRTAWPGKGPYREAQRDAERVADDIIAKRSDEGGEAEIDEPEAQPAARTARRADGAR